jgi:MerR family transcriptional regulator, redox-sensitive transcriptional activator SoxR
VTPVRAPHTPAETELTIGELAARSGMSISALRFYERQGILHPRRTAGNQRRYPQSAIELVTAIMLANRAGLPLHLFRDVLCRFVNNPRPAGAHRAGLRLDEEIASRIVALERFRALLAHQPNPISGQH